MREILRAASAAEAVRLKKENPGAFWLAGGTELLRLGGTAGPEAILIDLSAALDRTIRVEDGCLSIGALASFEDVVASASTPAWLKEAAMYMANFTTRCQARVAGDVCSFRDDAYLVPGLLTAGASLLIEGEGKVDLLDFIHARRADRLVTSILVPLDAVVRVKRIARSSSTHSALNAAYGPCGYYALVNGTGLVTADEVASASYVDDLTGSAAYKRYIASECLSILKEVAR